MKITTISIREHAGITRTAEPVTIGIPFQIGVLPPAGAVALVDPKGNYLQATLKPSAYWSDGSLRWGLLDFQVSMPADTKAILTLLKADGTNAADQSPKPHIHITETTEELSIDSGKTLFKFNKQHFNPFTASYTPSLPGRVALTDEDGLVFTAKIDTFSLQHQADNLSATLSVNGHFTGKTGTNPLRFSAIITIYSGHSLVKIDFTLTNPHAASHPGGLWDLGDAGSSLFQSLSFDIELDGIKSIALQNNTEEIPCPFPADQFSIDQYSSGGQNWQSHVHKNRAGLVSHPHHGYQCIANANTLSQGDRITPTLFIEHTLGTLGLHINQFWQNFPKGMSIDHSNVHLMLFPNADRELFELQGGEQKTHSIYIDHSANDKALVWAAAPLQAQLTPEYYIATGAMSYLSIYDAASPFNTLISAGITGEDSFFCKREIIDEYGWRNFGELYADHETLGHEGEHPLVSHYNNQYDPIYGFARQYLLTGDVRWYELMDDLAKHVIDIDIYHTDDDKPEYNGGLFWHTNHYLDTETCTHRTFSKRHPAVTSDGPSGGGPGSEHCYSTGLLYHYYLTGSDNSFQAVSSLINWVLTALDLPNTVLGRLHRALKNGLPTLIELLKQKMVYDRKYPLTRGTGNFINTLIDAYQLYDDKHYLATIDEIIRQTVHPNDKILERNFSDIENTWSYTVFFQAVARYLDIKESILEIDDSFIYARDSLAHYADHILDHEPNYLSSPEKLDYPNMTWVAQEVRKSNLLCMAFKFTGGEKLSYLTRAYTIYDYVAEQLTNNPEATYTRILVILMQNHGPYDFFREEKSFPQYLNFTKSQPRRAANFDNQ